MMKANRTAGSLPINPPIVVSVSSTISGGIVTRSSRRFFGSSVVSKSVFGFISPSPLNRVICTFVPDRFFSIWASSLSRSRSSSAQCVSFDTSTR